MNQQWEGSYHIRRMAERERAKLFAKLFFFFSLIVILIPILIGCGPSTPEQAQRFEPVPMSISESDRFEVVRVSVFKDPLAYYNKRGIYLIRDKKTGAEFVGVSGVGISEVSRHQAGKNSSIEDER